MSRERIQELTTLLNKYAIEYYENDAPSISDAAYDVMYDELRKLEEKENFSLPDSPVHRVGGSPLAKCEQKEHIQRLYSLDKAQTFEEVLDWYNRAKKMLGTYPEVTIEYKFDGLTLNILYENGYLKEAKTRGNGVVGEVVTKNAETIKQLPKKIEYKGKVEVVGECVMRLSSFNKYNETANVPLKNARNAAAGGIRNLDPKLTATRNLSFFAYNIGYSDCEFTSQDEMRKFLTNQGFEMQGDYLITSKIEDVKKYIDKTDKLRPTLDYLIDGIVIKVNKISERAILKETDKFPRWAIAYKFKAEENTTKLLDVIWQVSRTNKLNPIALVEPVDICGATISRATLNNIFDIRRKKIAVNDVVLIRRSNDVIPEIMGVYEEGTNRKEIVQPEECPYCKSPVRVDGAFLYCTNRECEPAVISRITHFVSKPGFNIDGLSEKTIEVLYDFDKLRNVADLFKLEEIDFFGIEGFKSKKINNILTSIDKSKKIDLGSFLYALGIEGIGKRMAQDVAKYAKTVSNAMKLKYADIIKIEGIGEVIAENYEKYFSDQANISTINELFELGVKVANVEEAHGILDGKVIVITGSFNSYSRHELEEKASKLGATFLSSVSSKTNLIFLGENPGSKYEKAKALNIPMLTESEINKLLNDSK